MSLLSSIQGGVSSFFKAAETFAKSVEKDLGKAFAPPSKPTAPVAQGDTFEAGKNTPKAPVDSKGGPTDLPDFDAQGSGGGGKQGIDPA